MKRAESPLTLSTSRKTRTGAIEMKESTNHGWSEKNKAN